MRKQLLTTLSCCFIINSNCYATDGFYLNPAVGYTNISNWWSGSLALTLNAGWQYNNYLASEIGYTWIQPITTPTSNGNTASQYQSMVDLAAKGALPLSDIFDVYIKGGLGLDLAAASSNITATATPPAWSGNTSVTSYGLYLALGGELKLNQHFSFTFEDYGMIPIVGDSWGNINIFALGAKYLF